MRNPIGRSAFLYFTSVLTKHSGWPAFSDFAARTKICAVQSAKRSRSRSGGVAPWTDDVFDGWKYGGSTAPSETVPGSESECCLHATPHVFYMWGSRFVHRLCLVLIYVSASCRKLKEVVWPMSIPKVRSRVAKGEHEGTARAPSKLFPLARKHAFQVLVAQS
jgi:hypothetical protein